MSHTPTTSCETKCNPCQDYDKQVDAFADLPSFDPDFLNDQFSFPYPKNGTVKRDPGEGCLNCVHSGYCQALYWFRRNTQQAPDDHNGIQCDSWSPLILDQVTSSNDYDVEENSRLSCQGVI